MQRNGSGRWLDHLINTRNDPANAAAMQADLNKYRLSRIQESLKTRPVFTPLSYTLLLAGQIPAFKATTPSLGYDVIYTGFKTDIWPARDIELTFTESEQRLVRTGNVTNLFLRSDEIMGHSVDAGGGQVGVFTLPNPIVVRQGDRITIGVYKTDATAADLNANIVLIGTRVYQTPQLAPKEIDQITRAISLRPTPKQFFVEVSVDYVTATLGNVATNIFSPTPGEPVIIRGVRTDLRLSKVEMGLTGEPRWTVNAVPTWGVAAETELFYDNYQWFSKGVYLASDGTIEIPRITNGIDGLTPDSATGRFTFYCETA